MTPSLSEDSIRDITTRLSKANNAFAQIYPGETGKRQPVHTVYGGAHLFKSDSAERLGALARRSLDQFAPDFLSFAKAIELAGADGLPDSLEEDSGLLNRLETNDEQVRLENRPAWFAHAIYNRVSEKLRREPVEDFRVDFEDGYGNRPDDEEDGHAASAALEVATGMENGTLPPFIGIRIKPFTEELRARSMRTLDIFVSTLVEKSGGRLPENFVVTQPKITIPEQVSALADLFELVEQANGLQAGSLKLEMMIETTQSIINARGEINLPLLLAAARGRCVAAHFGTYDYTASCSITAAHQHMMHPACDFAQHMMQVSFAGTGIWLSDGATNIMPVAPHRFSEGGTPLTPEQIAENRDVVHRAWKLHYDHIQHSLENAFIRVGTCIPHNYQRATLPSMPSSSKASTRLRSV